MMHAVVERAVWDGDQVLAEVRADGGETATGAQMDCDNCTLSRANLEGIVLYTLGGGLDHPLDIYSAVYNDVVVPVYSWRGRAVDGVCVSGSQFCTDFAWPARGESATFDTPPVTDPNYGGPIAWGGNLIDTQQDGSGLIYKRNRYYDPSSGRFTQVDPIGLGGGLSAYGFANGDQVSYQDPFGLCPMCVGAVVGVATGFVIAKVTGSSYTLKDAAVDAALGAAGAGLVGKLAKVGKMAAKAAGIADSKLGKVVIGETMKRVEAVAAKIGGETFTTAATDEAGIMADNMKWVNKAMDEGKEIVDIGEDAAREVRSKFYKAEKAAIKARDYPVTSHQ